MREYTSKQINDTAKINEDIKANILLNWIADGVKLAFNLDSSTKLIGALVYVSKYDYIVHLEGQSTISILAKHAVSWIDRV